MTGDPKRWLDDGTGASALERDLLRSDADIEPPPQAHGAVWAALATRLPPVDGDPSGGGSSTGGGSAPIGSGGAGAPLATAATKTAIGGILVKAVAAVAIAGSVLTVGAYALRAPDGASHVSTAPTQQAPSLPASEVPTTPNTASALAPPIQGTTTEPRGTIAEPSATPAPAVTPSARQTSRAGHMAGPQASHAPARSAAVSVTSSRPATESQPLAGRIDQAPPPPPADSSPKVDTLREESALLASARSAVRAGDARSALGTLEVARSRYPSGALAQEREVLTIEALSQSGDVDGASARANGFLKAFPSSPHAAHVRTFVR